MALIIFPILIVVLEKRELSKKQDVRRRQLLDDYPELISKFSLLTHAGLSINNALERISRDYKKALENNQSPRFVYEELVITCQKIKNGVYESYAYEDMGRRYGLPCYIKFSSILISGLKRGNSDFNRLLSEEVTASLLEHKAEILQKSSKISTKLLGPMMLIFVVILLLIMVPAFFSMTL